MPWLQRASGRSEFTGLPVVFALNQTVVAATVDEGNNWINLGYGPLSLSKPTDYTGANIALVPLGNYSIKPGSPTIDVASSVDAPNHDFFGNIRPQDGGFDIGAVELVVAVVSPSTLNFDKVQVEETSSVMSVTLTNAGTDTLTFTGVTFTGTNAGSFQSPANTCTTSLAAGASCTIDVTFTPATLGSLSANMKVNDMTGTTSHAQTVALSGTGVEPSGTVTVP